MAIWKPKTSGHVLEKNGAIPDLVWRFLSQRAQSNDDLQKILQPSLGDLKDPYLLFDMDRAVKRLVEAFGADEKICIYADFDLDGTSGLAVLNNGLKKIGFRNVIYYQPKRLAEGYGFHARAVDDLSREGVSLIVTVDVGITSFAAFEQAKMLGLDVILTDHHLPVSQEVSGQVNEKLPDAYSIINPNQKRCTAGLGYLCGAGVAFYLVRALKRRFFETPHLPKNDWDLKEVLDFFCIGTLTDMVPLVDDNRILVKHGMLALQNTTKPGLRALLDELNLSGRDLTSQDVSIKFAPKLNALSRMESEVLPRDIYLVETVEEARRLVRTMMKNNETRQSLQQSSIEEAEKSLMNWPHDRFVFVASPEFHRGIIGLIATKLANDTNRPAFVGSVDEAGVVVGSSRLPSANGGNLVNALGYCETFLNRYGGHAAAAGFEFHAANQSSLVEKLREYYETVAHIHGETEIEYETEAALEELTPHNLKWYNFSGPYGVGFSIPLFRFNQLHFTQVKEIKGGHIKVVAAGIDLNVKVDILYFSPTDAKRKELLAGRSYDVLGEVQINYFNNKQTIQILMRDFKFNG